jgi:nucleotide-binding universal stress UspA family protein
MKVLIAIDSSAGSQHVLDEAAVRPWPLDTSFLVLNVVDVERFARLRALIEDAKREGYCLVKAGSTQLVHSGHKASNEVMLGFPRKAISECAEKSHADLIMVGSHGHSAIGRFLLGSVAQAVLRTAPCPVEIVRFPSGGSAPSSHPMKVLLATDGSEYSVAAANSVATRRWPTGTVFKVVSVEELIVIETPMGASPLASIYPASLLEELVTDAHNRVVHAIEVVTNILEKAGCKVLEQSPIPVGDPRNLILDLAKSWSADLIVLGSHGRRGLDRFLMGSVSESVAVHSHCSVEVIRPQTARKD